MRFYTELKILFSMLNKKAYYEANKSHLGVGLRRFQQWFNSEASDKEAIKAKPKPEKLFKQNILRASDVRKSLPVHLRVHLQGDHYISRNRRK
eukprot:UN04633